MGSKERSIFRVDDTKHQAGKIAKVVAAVAVLGAAAGFVGCGNNEQEQPISTPTGIEVTQPPKPLFDFPPPSGKSCFDTFQYIYQHFGPDGYLVAEGGRYIILGSTTGSGSVMLTVYIDGKNGNGPISDGEFDHEKEIVRDRLYAWLKQAGVNPEDALIGIGQGFLKDTSTNPSGKSPFPYLGTTETSIGSKSGECLRRPGQS